MRRNLPLVVLMVLVGCASSERAAVVSGPEEGERIGRPLPYGIDPPTAFRKAVARGTRTSTGRPGEAYWIQHATYRLRAKIDPASRRLEGVGDIVYSNNSPDTLHELHLELVQNLHKEGGVRHEFAEITGGVILNRVEVNGEELFDLNLSEEGAPHFAVNGTDLTLRPDAPVLPGTSVRIAVEWEFEIPQQGAGARMGHEGGNLLFLAYWYPIMSVYDDVEGWYTEQFTGQSEFYADFADYEVTIELPSGWLVAATGELQNPEEVLSPPVLQKMRRAYESDDPVQVVGPADFASATRPGRMLAWQFHASRVRDFAFSATRESIWDAARTPVGDRDGDGDVDYARINTFYRESAPLWSEVTRYQQHSITFHSNHTGFAYPWPHMTAIEGGGIIGGGMEFPMMTLMGDYNTRGDSALYYVTAHELAHMWIPLVVNTNERRFSWIDEGFTTFSENVAREDFYPGTNPHRGDQDAYSALARRDEEGAMMRHSAYHESSLAFGVASYAKPATVLHALRRVLGQDTFYRAYRTFIDEWAYRHPYPWDLFNTFERVSGDDLDWFWRTWYYETWTLDQAITDVQIRGNRTTVVVENQGYAVMPVILEFEMADGESITEHMPVDTWMDGDTTATVTVTTRSPIVRIVIDPLRSFPDIDQSDNRWVKAGAATF